AQPADPTRTGYTFAGWFREAAGTTPWAFPSDTVTQAVTLYAKWVPASTPSFVVTFDSQGGSSVTSQTVAQGEKAAQPAEPTRTGYTFAGWFKEAAGTTPWAFPSDTVTQAVTLYAKWVLNTFSLTYAAGSGGSITGITSQTVGYGQSGTAVNAVPDSGFRFVGWSDASTTNPRTEVNVTAGLSVTATFEALTGTVVAGQQYAWGENVGWINFQPAGGGTSARLGTNGSLTGMAWSENLGWIRLSAEGATAPFANTTAGNWGVNISAAGALTGFAWSENGGWIRFGDARAGAAIDQATGALSGHAWGENVGWISLSGSGYGVRFGL
ncbi:MAG: InlB B-repeat-containing protein, partial [Candidatus Riflebacteria bacterium]|nr:InlB B-repeat-containing protein [Candidatus Riflebacteria bacterium]